MTEQELVARINDVCNVDARSKMGTISENAKLMVQLACQAFYSTVTAYRAVRAENAAENAELRRDKEKLQEWVDVCRENVANLRVEFDDLKALHESTCTQADKENAELRRQLEETCQLSRTVQALHERGEKDNEKLQKLRDSMEITLRGAMKEVEELTRQLEQSQPEIDRLRKLNLYYEERLSGTEERLDRAEATIRDAQGWLEIKLMAIADPLTKVRLQNFLSLLGQMLKKDANGKALEVAKPEPNKLLCPECHGAGDHDPPELQGVDARFPVRIWCGTCDGSGRVGVKPEEQP